MYFLKEIAILFFSGFVDCFVGVLRIKNVTPVSRKSFNGKEFRKLFKNIVGCFLLNIVIFGLSSYLIDSLLFYFVSEMSKVVSVHEVILQNLHFTLTFLFHIMWVLPLYVVSRIVNCILFHRIANAAFEMACGKTVFSFGVSLIVDVVSSIFIELLFFVQFAIVSFIPVAIIAEILSFVHLCLLYSLYAFEYKWCNMGWTLEKRLNAIEYSWPYFLGFGLPLAYSIMMVQSFVAKICMFSLIFPICVISSIYSSPGVGNIGYRPRFFAPAMKVFNFLVKQVLKPDVKRVNTHDTTLC